MEPQGRSDQQPRGGLLAVLQCTLLPARVRGRGLRGDGPEAAGHGQLPALLPRQHLQKVVQAFLPIFFFMSELWATHQTLTPLSNGLVVYVRPIAGTKATSRTLRRSNPSSATTTGRTIPIPRATPVRRIVCVSQCGAGSVALTHLGPPHRLFNRRSFRSGEVESFARRRLRHQGTPTPPTFLSVACALRAVCVLCRVVPLCHVLLISCMARPHPTRE